MSPRKLSDSDRQEILELYRQTEETTSSLANRFGVSSSTISRFLKSSLSQSEYEDLIQAKRLSRTSRDKEKKTKKTTSKTKAKKSTTKSKRKKPSVKSVKTEKSEANEQLQLEITKEKEDSQVTFDQQVDQDSLLEEAIVEDDDYQTNEQVEEVAKDTETEILVIEGSEPELEEEEEEDADEESLESVQEVGAMLGEDFDEQEDDDEEDDDDDDDESIETALSVEPQLQVLSLNDASFPPVCYLVIDRYSELVTKPMKDFAHLGNIPSSEISQKTLPIFDNHKVAKRFCVRKGKVIKVPDGRVFQKTSNYLQAKGISRILMDGKVYSIVD